MAIKNYASLMFQVYRIIIHFVFQHTFKFQLLVLMFCNSECTNFAILFAFVKDNFITTFNDKQKTAVFTIFSYNVGFSNTVNFILDTIYCFISFKFDISSLLIVCGIIKLVGVHSSS
ncbi:hypothetical protein BX667DRAFT_503577 [Coemansia mojavensis]|nr:hypothetical protein BX667DRAFT_503577 [Coemansia mojavensis]